MTRLSADGPDNRLLAFVAGLKSYLAIFSSTSLTIASINCIRGNSFLSMSTGFVLIGLMVNLRERVCHSSWDGILPIYRHGLVGRTRLKIRLELEHL